MSAHDEDEDVTIDDPSAMAAALSLANHQHSLAHGMAYLALHVLGAEIAMPPAVKDRAGEMLLLAMDALMFQLNLAMGDDDEEEEEAA